MFDSEVLINQCFWVWVESFIEDFVNIFKLVILVVVNINMLSVSGYWVFFGFGVIIVIDGYIIINYYVIEDGVKYEIIMYDKCKFEVEFIGFDFIIDFVLFKFDVWGFKLVFYGDFDKVEVGQWVFVVGNFFNFFFIVIVGIVSVKVCNINILCGLYSIEFFI